MFLDDGRRYELPVPSRCARPSGRRSSPTSSWRPSRTSPRSRCRSRRCSYWMVDPEVPNPTVHELDAEGCYGLVAEAEGEDPFDASLPFPVRIVPAELLGDLCDRSPE